MVVEEAFRKLALSRTLDGNRIFWELFKVRSSFLIFLDNKIDLDSELKNFETYFSQVNTSEKETRRKQRKLIRHVVNYLSSAQSLKEHLLIKQGWVGPKDVNTILYYFFRELRNLLVHNMSLPLISRRTTDNKNGENKLIVEQAIDKAIFLNFLEEKRELPVLKEKTKQLKQIVEVIEWISKMPDGTIFNKLLAEYHLSLIVYYKGWVKNYVKLNRKSLAHFNEIVKQIHETPIDKSGRRITNLPINIYQNRWLSMWLSFTQAK